MPKANLNLRRKNDDELAAYCANHKTKMAGNATFPTPLPTALIFDAALVDFSTKLAGHRAAQDTVAQMLMTKEASRGALEAFMTQRGGYLEITAADEAQMLSGGVEPRSAGGPIGEMPGPQNLVATMGDLEDLQTRATAAALAANIGGGPNRAIVTRHINSRNRSILTRNRRLTVGTESQRGGLNGGGFLVGGRDADRPHQAIASGDLHVATAAGRDAVGDEGPPIGREGQRGMTA